MQNNRKIRIFAGPNGSGKSSLFNEFSKHYNTGYFINADNLEKSLSYIGLVDLSEIGIVATQEDLEAFKKMGSSQSLLLMAQESGHDIDIKVKLYYVY